jgi:hypothetical protein
VFLLICRFASAFPPPRPVPLGIVFVSDFIVLAGALPKLCPWVRCVCGFSRPQFHGRTAYYILSACLQSRLHDCVSEAICRCAFASRASPLRWDHRFYTPCHQSTSFKVAAISYNFSTRTAELRRLRRYQKSFTAFRIILHRAGKNICCCEFTSYASYHLHSAYEMYLNVENLCFRKPRLCRSFSLRSKYSVYLYVVYAWRFCAATGTSSHNTTK